MKKTFEKRLFSRLRKPGDRERFFLPQGALPHLAAALEADLARDAAGTVTRVLQLIVAFDAKASPSVAEALRGLLRKNEEAQRAVRRTFFGSGTIDRRRRFLRQEARGLLPRAPVYGAAAPADTIPLSSMLNPGRDRPRRRPLSESAPSVRRRGARRGR